MISKELKHLSRRELVDIIYQLKTNEQEMQKEIDSLKNELEDKRIRVSVAGSIADAAMSMTNVFSTAQMTADLYLREISYMKENTEKECAKKLEDAQKMFEDAQKKTDEAEGKVKDILAAGEKKFDTLKTAYKEAYTKWQRLKAEIAALENKKQELCEETTND